MGLGNKNYFKILLFFTIILISTKLVFSTTITTGVPLSSSTTSTTYTTSTSTISGTTFIPLTTSTTSTSTTGGSTTINPLSTSTTLTPTSTTGITGSGTTINPLSTSTTTGVIPVTTSATTTGISTTGVIPIPVTTGVSPVPIPILPSTVTISKTLLQVSVNQDITFGNDQSFKFTDYTLLQVIVTDGKIEQTFPATNTLLYSMTSSINIPSSFLANKNITIKLKIGTIGSSIDIPFTVYIYYIETSVSQIGQSLKIKGINLENLENNLFQVKTSNNILNFQSSNSTNFFYSLSGILGDFNGIFHFFYNGLEIFNTFLQMQVYVDYYIPKNIDTQSTISIYGLFFVNSSNSIVSITTSNGNLYFVDFILINANTINIPATNFKDLVNGLATMTYKHNTSYSGVSTSISNSITMAFLQPKIDSMDYNRATGELVVSGIFLPSSYYLTYLAGIVLNQVAPTQSNESRLVFSNPKMIYGSPYFSCGLVSSKQFPSFTVNLKPTLNYIDKIPKRKDKIIYFSGSFLSKLNQFGGEVYEISIYSNTSGQSIPCTNLNELNFNPIGQLYNMSCSVSDYLLGATNLQIKISNETIYMGDSISFGYGPPTIESVSSTFYGVPNQMVTISGSFCKIIDTITIGGESCNEITLISINDLNRINCKFSSNVGSGYSENSLPVSITCENQTFTADMFLYKRDDPCPSFNGNICSGLSNGVCNSTTRKCDCLKGFAGFDCSIAIVLDLPIPIPTIKNAVTSIDVTSTKSSLMANIDGSSTSQPSPVRFDIGIIQIREIDTFNGNKIIKYVDLKNREWNLTSESSTRDNSIYNYKSIINNDDGTYILIQITVNSNQQTQYDFLGDSIDILPNSVKYQVEIDSWKFDSPLTSIQLLFESKITNTDCENQQPNQNIQLYGSSIRTIQTKTITGKTLVGTFSNRMKVDDRVVVSTIQVLNEQDLISSNITSNNRTTIQAITIPSSKKAIIDPNFGVLLSNDESITKDGNNLCQVENINKQPLANWKIAVAVVCSAIGLSLIILSSIIFYRRVKNRSYMINIRLKLSKRNKKQKFYI